MTDNVSTNIICLLIMLSLSRVIRSQRHQGPAGRLYYYIGLLTLFELFIEILASVCYSHAWIMAQIVLTIYYATNPLLGAVWIIYVYMITCPKFGKRERRIAPWLITPYYIYGIIGFSNPFTHIFFSLSKDMQFIRHDEMYHWLSISTYVLLSIVGVAVLIKNYKAIKEKFLFGLILSYIAMIGGGIWAQATIDGWLMLNATLTVVYVITYFTIQNHKVTTLSKDLEESEKTKKEVQARALAEERFRLVARDSNDIVFEINLEHQTVVANENYYKTFGEEAAFDLLWEDKTIHPDDREKFNNMKHRLIHAEKGVPLELRLKTKEGDYKWFMLNISAFKNEAGHINRIMGKYSDIDLQTHERELLEHRAQIDTATGLYNKAATQELITIALSKAAAGAHSALLIADIDDLKKINDTLGHAEGDRAIAMVAENLRMHFRATDILGRIGGDEFLILLDGMCEEEKLRSTLTALGHKISSLRVGAKNDYPVRCSMGLVVTNEGDSFEELYSRADKALYFVKRETKNAFAMYTPDMEKSGYEYKDTKTNIRNTVFYDVEETTHLLGALADFYPMIASLNLTQDSYYLLEYEDYGISFGPEMGLASELLNSFVEAAHPAEREEFREICSIENALKVYDEGQNIVQYVGRQRMPSGLFRWTKMVAVLSENQEKELCAVIFMRPVAEKNSL